MKRLEAAQVVYGNVEAARSARRQGGFQVLFRSSSHLTEDDVTREIEPRLFLDVEVGQQTKRVFSVIGGDRIVLAQVIPVAGTDEHGRHGLYFGHALVFSKNDFRKVDNNPFLIFDSFPFFTSIDEAIARGGNDRGDIPLVSISFPRRITQDEYDGLSREQLFELTRFSRRLLKSTEHGSSLVFYGNAGNVFDILRDMFFLLPTQLRFRCSFDTLFAGGNYGKTPYFAFGLPLDHSRDRRFAGFDVERGELSPAVGPASLTSYDLWLKWMLKPPLPEIAGYTDEAVRIAAVLDGEVSTGDQRQRNVDSLLPFRAIVEKRLENQAKGQLGEILGNRIVPQVLAWAREQGAAVLDSLRRDFSCEQLEGWLTAAYSNYHERPSTTELEQLGRFSAENQRSFLRLVYLRWMRQWPELRATLRSLETSPSDHFKKWALATMSAQVQPVANPQPGHGLLFGLNLAIEGDEAAETSALIAALLDVSMDANGLADMQALTANSKSMFGPDTIKNLLGLVALLVDHNQERS
jgi:hypothetical protein